jgi:hypothetical protein
MQSSGFISSSIGTPFHIRQQQISGDSKQPQHYYRVVFNKILVVTPTFEIAAVRMCEIQLEDQQTADRARNSNNHHRVARKL